MSAGGLPSLTGVLLETQLSATGVARKYKKQAGQGGFRAVLIGSSRTPHAAGAVLKIGAPYLVGASLTRSPVQAAVLTIPGGAVNLFGTSFTRSVTASATFTPGGATGGDMPANSFAVGPTATGDGTGRNWNNRLAWGTLSFVRGRTYYLMAGSYAGRTFSTAALNTTPITIKKATTADHGTNTGWSDTFASGQAIFTSGLWFSSPYWVIDGQTGWWVDGSQYGIRINETGSTTPITGFAIGGSNCTLRHIQMVGRTDIGTGGGSLANDAIRMERASNVTISYFEVTTTGRCVIWGCPNNTVLEHAWVKAFHSSGPVHSELASLSGTLANPGTNGDFTMRYSLITHIESTGGIMWDSQTNASSTCRVYGNVFYNMNNDFGTTGNGLMGGWTGGGGETCRNYKAFNNTVIGASSSNMPIFASLPNIFSGNEARNNLFYNCAAVDFGCFTNHSHNHYINTGGSAGDTSPSTGSGNPFVDMTGLDFRLLAATTNGTPLGSPYTQDAWGVTRGADGTWDRGAFEKV